MKTFKIQSIRFVSVVFTLACFVGPAIANPFEDLEECRTIENEAERLACFDAASAQQKAFEPIERAPAVDTEAPGAQMKTKKEKTSRFRLPFFGDRKSGAKDAPQAEAMHADPPAPQATPEGSSHVEYDDAGNVNGVRATVTKVGTNGLGYTTLTLANGQIWQSRERRLKAKIGEVVSVQRTRFGGHFLRIGDRSAVRVSRVDKQAKAKPASKNAPKANEKTSNGDKESFLSRLSPFGRSGRDQDTSLDAPVEDADFGKIVPVGTTEDTFGRTKQNDAQRAAEQKTLTQAVSSVMVDSYNMFIVTLANGQVWRQTEGKLKIREGDTVTIRKAALGSHLLQVEGKTRSVRVKRVD